MRSLLRQNNFYLRCLNYKQTRSVCGLRSVVNPQHIMVCPVPNAINFRGKKQPKVRWEQDTRHTSASRSTLCFSSSLRTSTWPFWLAACMAVCPAHCPFTWKQKDRDDHIMLFASLIPCLCHSLKCVCAHVYKRIHKCLFAICSIAVS